MLLVCKEEWGLRRGYNAVMSLPVDDMEILESETSVDTGYVIIVKTKSFVLQLHFDAEDDKLAWVKVLPLHTPPIHCLSILCIVISKITMALSTVLIKRKLSLYNV